MSGAANLANKLVKYCKENIKYLILSAILIFVLVEIFLIKLGGLATIPQWLLDLKYLIVAAIVVGGIVISLAINYVFRKGWSPQKIFLAFVIPIGLLLMIFFPVGRVPDEYFHFARAYGVSQGQLVADLRENGMGGSEFSENVMKAVHWERDLTYGQYLDNFKYVVKDGDAKNFERYTNTAQYPFLTYLPQAAGIKVASAMNLPVLWMALFGRLFNFAVWVALMFFAIKLMPFKKMSVLFFAFMPMMLQESISLSADPLVNGAAFLLISYVLHLRYGVDRLMNIKDWSILSILIMIVSVCKIIYMPICLVVFLIPKERFKSKKIKYIGIGILAAAAILITALWVMTSIKYQLRPDDGVNASLQIKYGLGAPLEVIKAVIRTLANNLYIFIENISCNPLGWKDIPIDSWCPAIMTIMLVLVGVLDVAKTKIKKYDKLCMGIITFLVVALIFAAEYLTWTPVSGAGVDGIQGRYFIPILIPIFMMINASTLKFDLSKIFRYIFLIVVAIDFYAIITVFFAHVLGM